MGDTSQPRDHFIKTAVTFLQNPKVQQSPIEHQQAFLKKKGLSDEEIGIAFERSRALIQQNEFVTSPSTIVQIPNQLAPPLPSAWTKLWDFFNTLMFVAGVSYSLYYLYKKFLAPLLFGRRDKKPSIEESIKLIQESLNKSVLEMKESLREVKETLDSQQQELIRLALLRTDGADINGGNGDAATKRTLHDMKAEITSIKGLLLNRRQFPSTPNPNPSIPAWQLSQDTNGNSGARGESAESSSPTSEYYKVRDLEDLCVGSNETVMIGQSEVTGEGSDSSLEMVRE